MSDYTPTTEEMHSVLASALTAKQMRQLAKWLAEYRRKVKAQAWEEGLTSAFEVSWGTRPANPYRQGEN